MSAANRGIFASAADLSELLRQREKFDSINGIFAYQPILRPNVLTGSGRNCALLGATAATGLQLSRRAAAPASPASASGVQRNRNDGGLGRNGNDTGSADIRADVRSIPRAGRYK